MNERIESYVRNPLITLAAGGVIGAAVGAGSTYIWIRRKFDEKMKVKQLEFDFTAAKNGEVFNRSVIEIKNVADQLRGQGAVVIDNLDTIKPGEHPEIVVERIIQPDEEVLSEYEIESVVAVDIETDPEHITITRNVFDGDDTWDYELERSNRNPEKPYVIHVDEFVADEMGWDSQSTLTWYEGDEILTDEREGVIYNPKEIIGELKWGHGSGDPNTFYVRNEKLHAEYEILRDPDSYVNSVLGGLEVEEQYAAKDLKHSKQPLRFRDD